MIVSLCRETLAAPYVIYPDRVKPNSPVSTIVYAHNCDCSRVMYVLDIDPTPAIFIQRC